MCVNKKPQSETGNKRLREPHKTTSRDTIQKKKKGWQTKNDRWPVCCCVLSKVNGIPAGMYASQVCKVGHSVSE